VAARALHFNSISAFQSPDGNESPAQSKRGTVVWSRGMYRQGDLAKDFNPWLASLEFANMVADGGNLKCG